MALKTKKDIIKIIQQDKWMMKIMGAASSLNLPDWWICAGFVRSKIWDVLHEFNERTLTPDIDVIYYDPTNIEVRVERELEEKLNKLLPSIPWSVKNQARMHILNHIAPYSSAVDAISKFPETATALGVKLNIEGEVLLTAPHGIEDVINMKVRPTSFFADSIDRMVIYEKRRREKKWKSIWTKIDISEI